MEWYIRAPGAGVQYIGRASSELWEPGDSEQVAEWCALEETVETSEKTIEDVVRKWFLEEHLPPRRAAFPGSKT